MRGRQRLEIRGRAYPAGRRLAGRGVRAVAACGLRAVGSGEPRGAYYTLASLDGYDNNLTPKESDCWGEIADYDPQYNAYALDGHDYVVYGGLVFVPGNGCECRRAGAGSKPDAGRPAQLQPEKAHGAPGTVQLAKRLIAPNNVSVVRMRDYEDSMRWLSDASKLRLNPADTAQGGRGQQTGDGLAAGDLPERLRPVQEPVADLTLNFFGIESGRSFRLFRWTLAAIRYMKEIIK